MKIKKANNKASEIPLFYWSEIRFLFKNKENYGDLLSRYLVEKISGRRVKWIHPKKQAWYKRNKTNFLAIGSILPHADKNSIVWGSGIIDRKHKIERADFRAVRGPRTRSFLLNLGYSCPEVYGDPALLLPRYFHISIKPEYKVGIIPHYNDYQEVKDLYKDDNSINVVDLMTMDVEQTTREILKCESTISSSLHGLIVSHAFNIPSVWVEFSNKIFGDGVKYEDYLESIDMPLYHPPFINEKKSAVELEDFIKSHPNLPDPIKLKALQEELLETWPFQ
ncbi:polysaccharide pyruvyl transferase family protein [Christiangramia sp. ASW11-125]|uniref:polysaccharide pyruvyl transferase family protein n=1 Tax=Christiangramia sp. ASW11-125 TaxID=3400701 RepID=UPI003AAFE56F